MLKRILLIPDCHVPFEHVAAFKLLLKVAAAFQFHAFIILGDFADFYSVSSHSKDPRRVQQLDDEVAAVNRRLGQLAKLRPEKFVYVMGNHEDRLARYLMSSAPALVDSIDLSVLFNFERHGIEMVPYKSSYKLGKLHLTHDTGTAGKNAHRTSAAAFMGSTIIGHTHRMAYEVTGTFEGLPYLSAMFGWLGDPSAVDYMHQVKAKEWAHGFGIGYLRSNGIVHVQPVPIIDGHCVVEGRLF